MDTRLRDLLAANLGVFSAHRARRLGVTDLELRQAVHAGSVVRIRRGAYVEARRYAAASPSERYRLRVAAVLATRDNAFASHHAGLAVHGLPLVEVDFRWIDVAAHVRHSTSRSGVRTAPVPPDEALVRVDGVPVLSMETCLVQTAVASGTVAGLVALDAALHSGQVTLGSISDAASRSAPRYGADDLRSVLALADSKAESPGETRTRLLLIQMGVPFVSQAPIVDAAGVLAARGDFLVAGRVIVEFDGAVKYADAQGRQALVREKLREDWLRSLGYEVVRLTWADLAHPERVIRLIRDAIARAGALLHPAS